MKLIAYTDGGSDRNGQAYVGVVMINEDGEIVCEHSHSIGKGTNNEAEYSAVILAIYQAIEEESDEIQIFCDSKLVVNQISGEWNIHENHIKEYHEEVMRLAKHIDIEVEWIPRAENKVADRLSRDCR
jgi:ribonuclease HI